ncbi:uncharacterized protein LOC120251423 [Dioscorea cayenensis subsp. rotundata]|uniref:Uncharacterized protein LOC120251423 n=1 Tax=Dioscorea cayennensis subsp. rotundata TaxID=55577 RepID=A0AB40AMD2_DIOCR|nr:uncharacterized protein LOC120251423 [Dioscorea cayenensis subsp. rotundata]
MEEWRSRAYGDDRMQIEVYRGGGGGRGVGIAPYPPSGMHDLRSYSASYAYSQQASQPPREIKLKKGKSVSASSSSSSAPKSSWSFKDPELQRKKRVAGYKIYTMEGRMKGSFRKSFRWLKDRYTQVVNGWW